MAHHRTDNTLVDYYGKKTRASYHRQNRITKDELPKPHGKGVTMEIGAIIKKRRVDIKLTQEEMAELLSVTPQAVS